jgi:hypothetical protein
MANEKTNIDSELTTIKNAPKGEDVRAAIISAIKKIYNTREYTPTTKKFTHNTGPEGESGGPWNKVIVQVNDSPSLDVDDMSQHPITENGYYDLAKLREMGFLDNPNCDGINGFTVNVKQTPGNFGVINITENGTYDPLLDGFDGYTKVYVNVLGGERKDHYTVKFYDGKNLLASVSVAYGQNATYPEGKALPDSGGLFTGWNPNPVSVSRDMNCYAVYAGQGATGAGTLVETIPDTWKTICTKIKAGNRPYEVGSTKLLRLTGYNGTSFILNMMLIGYNLDITQNGKYANSTWVNINPQGILMNNQAINYLLSPGFTLIPNPTAINQVNKIGTTVWWGNSLVRALYNRDPSAIIYKNEPGSDDFSYYKAMLSQGLTLPDAVNNAAGFDLFSQIEAVKKYSDWKQITSISGSTGQYNQYNLVDQPTIDKIWLPNYKEMLYPYPHTRNDYKETSAGQAGPAYGNPGVFYNTMISLELASQSWLLRDVASNSFYPNASGYPIIGCRPQSPNGMACVGNTSHNGTQNNYALPISFCI